MLTEEYRERNIERVLDEALLLCEEIGIPAVNKTNLARRAKLSPKSIQRYFDDKTDMIFKVSQKLMKRNDREIRELLKEKNMKEMDGISQLKWFLQVHNRYVLEKYKEMVFLQSADIYCRYAGQQPEKYWKAFRDSASVEKAIETFMKRGVEDGSIRKELIAPDFVTTVAVLCAGLVERLATDIDCQIVSVEEAIELSEGWINHVTTHLGTRV